MKNFGFTPELSNEIITLTLREDIGKGDVTSALLPKTAQGEAILLIKDHAILCGLPLIREVFKRIDKNIVIHLLVSEGDKVKPNQVAAKIKGPLHAILTGERTLLNLLSILSGIATLTHQFVTEIKGTKANIYDTRKTPPGLRGLAKYAVRVGGGKNHRMGLYDMVLVKDNHLSTLSVRESVIAARKRFKTLPVMVETESWSQFTEALEIGPDFILLDNMKTVLMKKAVGAAKKIKDRPKLEASGGITLKNVRAVAKTGVDRISIGALTHSYRNIDLSLEISRKD